MLVDIFIGYIGRSSKKRKKEEKKEEKKMFGIYKLTDINRVILHVETDKFRKETYSTQRPVLIAHYENERTAFYNLIEMQKKDTQSLFAIMCVDTEARERIIKEQYNKFLIGELAIEILDLKEYHKFCEFLENNHFFGKKAEFNIMNRILYAFYNDEVVNYTSQLEEIKDKLLITVEQL